MTYMNPDLITNTNNFFIKHPCNGIVCTGNFYFARHHLQKNPDKTTSNKKFKRICKTLNSWFSFVVFHRGTRTMRGNITKLIKNRHTVPNKIFTRQTVLTGTNCYLIYFFSDHCVVNFLSRSIVSLNYLFFYRKKTESCVEYWIPVDFYRRLIFFCSFVFSLPFTMYTGRIRICSRQKFIYCAKIFIIFRWFIQFSFIAS